MLVNVVSVEPPQSPPVALKTAARVLGCSPQVVRDALGAGLLPDLSPLNVQRAAAMRLVTSMRTAGGPVPVLRLGEVTVDDSDDPRGRYGYNIDFTARELLDSASRWWPKALRSEVVAAGALVAVRSTFVVAVLSVEGIAQVNDAGRIWYDSTLVGRALDPLAGEYEVLAATSSLVELAREVLCGRRILGGQGGSLTLLPDDDPRKTH